MTTLIHADIFFFVATIGFALIAIAFIVFIIVGILLIQEVRAMVKLLGQRADQAWADLKEFESKLLEKFGLLKVIKKIIGRFL